MISEILDHYMQYSMYTCPGLYKSRLVKKLPNDILEIGHLVRKSIIHRTTLLGGNTGTNSDLRFGDMMRVPWWRQPEDDILVTVSAMLSELYRRDARGFVLDRAPEDKLILTCRFIAILMASILKSKGIPARVRAGHAPYFDTGDISLSVDHWITQYWCIHRKDWVTIDVDGSLSIKGTFDPYDIPVGEFDFAADAWLSIRESKVDPEYFYNAYPMRGAITVLWSLFYDFHCLMNSEIIYLHKPVCGDNEKFYSLTEDDLNKIDELAKLMLDPDANFYELCNLWNQKKDYRILCGGLL